MKILVMMALSITLAACGPMRPVVSRPLLQEAGARSHSISVASSVKAPPESHRRMLDALKQRKELLEEANVAMKKQRYPTAEALIRETLDLAPLKDYPPAMLRIKLAECVERQGDTAQAAQLYQDILSAEKGTLAGSPGLLVHYGHLVGKLGKTSEARKAYEAARIGANRTFAKVDPPMSLRIQPGDVRAVHAAVHFLSALNDPSRLVSRANLIEYAKAIEIEPEWEMVKYLRARDEMGFVGNSKSALVHGIWKTTRNAEAQAVYLKGKADMEEVLRTAKDPVVHAMASVDLWKGDFEIVALSEHAKPSIRVWALARLGKFIDLLDLAAHNTDPALRFYALKQLGSQDGTVKGLLGHAPGELGNAWAKRELGFGDADLRRVLAWASKKIGEGHPERQQVDSPHDPKTAAWIERELSHPPEPIHDLPPPARG